MSPFCCHVRMPCAVNIWRIAPQKTSRFDAWNASSWIDSYLDLLLSDLKQKHTNLEHIGFGRFSELRRQIDAQREELKAKIDEIAQKFIEKTKEKEKAYNSKMEESLKRNKNRHWANQTNIDEWVQEPLATIRRS